MASHAHHAHIPGLALALGLVGLIPFVAGALALWLPLPWLAPDQGLALVRAYGALVLAFLGGIRWGTAIGPYGWCRQGLDFAGGVLGTLAGLAALFLPVLPALTLLLAGILMQALWDVTSVEEGRLPQWFGRLRMLMTSVAALALIAALAATVI
jgi:hypothetical protein